MKSDCYSPGVCPDRYVYAATAISTHTNASATTFALSFRFDPESAPVNDLKLAKISPRPDPFTETASEFASSTLPPDRSSTSYTNEFPTSTSKTRDQDEDSGGGSHDLSTGATAGIGVGTAIAGMAVVGFLWWFTKRYKAWLKLAWAEKSATNNDLRHDNIMPISCKV
ncbi:hypothetical protein HYE67_008051 [Fusarium culmorum]|uniref:Mid2 domain-containing protein n=1 Tax=Fusarium culmorum TaxID=5516 RepID=A0A7S8DCJ8_FUSCU|nr:hypothetical protein HYE67_008051 [Fusarium culmorum]